MCRSILMGHKCTFFAYIQIFGTRDFNWVSQPWRTSHFCRCRLVCRSALFYWKKRRWMYVRSAPNTNNQSITKRRCDNQQQRLVWRKRGRRRVDVMQKRTKKRRWMMALAVLLSVSVWLLPAWTLQGCSRSKANSSTEEGWSDDNVADNGWT